DIDTSDAEVVHLLCIKFALLNGFGENRRVGRHAHHMAIADQIGEVASAEPITTDVVDPYRDTGRRQLCERVTHDDPFVGKPVYLQQRFSCPSSSQGCRSPATCWRA